MYIGATPTEISNPNTLYNRNDVVQSQLGAVMWCNVWRFVWVACSHSAWQVLYSVGCLDHVSANKIYFWGQYMEVYFKSLYYYNCNSYYFQFHG